MLLSRNQVLTREELRFEPLPDEADDFYDAKSTLRDVERRHIERVLRAERGSVDRAAKSLDISRSALYEKLKRYGLSSRS